MSLKHAILGFLSYQPFTGYDLKKAFDVSIQHFWPANQSQIYRTLAGMLRDELVSLETVEREDRLDMKIYHITEQGRKELHQWLSTPLPAQDLREPSLIQIYFSGLLSDEEIRNLLQHEITASEERLAVYQGMLEHFAAQLPDHPHPRASFFSISTLEYGLRSEVALLSWLRSMVTRLDAEEYSFDTEVSIQ